MQYRTDPAGLTPPGKGELAGILERGRGTGWILQNSQHSASQIRRTANASLIPPTQNASASNLAGGQVVEPGLFSVDGSN